MKFSLILPTVGRSSQLGEFLNSLEDQNYPNVELIIVDQNQDNRIKDILDSHIWSFNVIHVQSDIGLSKARNKGLKLATGDIVAFPDDDCKYPPNLLFRLKELFETHPHLQGITGRSQSPGGVDTAGKFGQNTLFLNKFNVWKHGVSISIFLRNTTVRKIGLFDENLGLGARTIYQSGEETDFLLRGVKLKLKFLFKPDIIVFHEDPVINFDKGSIKRAYNYGCGAGKVLEKHSYPLWFKLKFLIRPLAGSIISIFSLNLAKSKYYIKSLQGRATGLLN